MIMCYQFYRTFFFGVVVGVSVLFYLIIIMLIADDLKFSIFLSSRTSSRQEIDFDSAVTTHDWLEMECFFLTILN